MFVDRVDRFEYMKSFVYENRIMNSKLIKPSDYGFKVQF